MKTTETRQKPLKPKQRDLFLCCFKALNSSVSGGKPAPGTVAATQEHLPRWGEGDIAGFAAFSADFLEFFEWFL